MSKKAQASKTAKNQDSVKAFAFPTTKSINQKIANSVKTSWEDPATRAARSKRDSVRVTHAGIVTQYSSLRKAFTAHKLPDRKHQEFRRTLKLLSPATFYNETEGGLWEEYLFEIIDLNKVEATSYVEQSDPKMLNQKDDGPTAEPKFKIGDKVSRLDSDKLLGVVDYAGGSFVYVDEDDGAGEVVEWEEHELKLFVEPVSVLSVGMNVAHKDVPTTLLGQVFEIQKDKGEGCDLLIVQAPRGVQAFFNASNLIEFVGAVEHKREPVRFDSLPLLCGFYMEEAKLNRATLEYRRPVSYVKVGNTSAIAVPVAFDEYPQREIRDPFIYLAHAATVDLSVKCRFKKSTKVFPIYPLTK
jgi:hypothetical protein